MNHTTGTIGPYQIVSELGRGGMGVVYKAWEDRLDRHVAIKLLADQYCDEPVVAARFMREARAVAGVHHPNLVQVFSVDNHQGRPYIVMEYVEGESLADRILREPRIESLEAVNLLRQAASGLAAAHTRGVVHRDVKPANLMLCKDGRLKVVDFGIAWVETPDDKLTVTGMAMGTPAYLSPEVCLAKSVDQRSDIFSLGVVFYEILTRKTPFRGDSPLEMMSKVVEARIPDLIELNEEIDPRIYQILKFMLASDPDTRYQNCGALIADLDDILAGRPPSNAANAPSPPPESAQHDEDATIALSTPPVGVAQSDQANHATADDRKQPIAEKKKHAARRWKAAAMTTVIALAVAGGTAAWHFAPNTYSSLPMFSQSPSTASAEDRAGKESPVAELEGRTDAEQASAEGDLMELEAKDPLVAEKTEHQSEAVAQVDAEPSATPHETGRIIEPGTDVEPTESQDKSADTPEAASLSREDISELIVTAGPLKEVAAIAPETSSSTTAQPSDEGAPATAASKPDWPERHPATGENRHSQSQNQDSTLEAATPAVSGAAPDTADQYAPDSAFEQTESWDRNNPRVALVVSGDRLSALPLRASLEQMLNAAGYRLMDPDFINLAADAGLAELSRELHSGGADVMVLVDIEPAGETELYYHGRFDTLYSVTVSLRAIQLHDKEPLAPLWQDSMRYTALNAEDQAREMANPIIDLVIDSLQQL